jgi:hypothetical protein
MLGLPAECMFTCETGVLHWELLWNLVEWLYCWVCAFQHDYMMIYHLNWEVHFMTVYWRIVLQSSWIYLWKYYCYTVILIRCSSLSLHVVSESLENAAECWQPIWWDMVFQANWRNSRWSTRVWLLCVCVCVCVFALIFSFALLNEIVCEIASRILALLSVCICFQNCIWMKSC